MARLFVGADATDKLTLSTFPGIPFTVSTWVKSSAYSATMTIFGMTDPSAGNNFHRIAYDNTAGSFTAQSFTPNGQAVSTLGTPTNAQWYNVVGVFTSSTSRSIYVNGANSATNTTSVSVSADTQTIGVLSRNAGDIHWWDGDIAEVATWNVSLSSAEILSLATGCDPRLIRSNSIQSYVPMVNADFSPELDYFGAGTWTVASAPAASVHPPTSRVRAQRLGREIPAAAGHVHSKVDQIPLFSKLEGLAR